MTDNSDLKACIFDIQRYSIHDGPGIRTTVFFKGCPLRCFWCQNPESQLLTPEVFLFKDKCTSCGLCVKACPSGAASIIAESSEIDRQRCTGCGSCSEACPNEARKFVGQMVSAGEILEIVMKDADFYRNSGGGITLSGGEPLLQPDFACEILSSCKNRGINTAVETTGYLPWENIEKVIGETDLFLYDIKHIDSVKHKEGTGVPNERILQHVRKINALKPVKVRVPLIPGFNDSPEVIRAIVDFVRTELKSVEMELLAYNKMDESKYTRLGRNAVSLQIQDEQYVEKLKELVK
jgi:pyruvate formate lyase activating enzyme